MTAIIFSFILLSPPTVVPNVAANNLPSGEMHPSTTMHAEEVAAKTQPLPLEKASTTPVSGIPVPANAIATPEGGFVTPLETTDANGKPLNIHYEKGIEGSGGRIVPACLAAHSGLYQEGNDWTTSADTSAIGAQQVWIMPSGSFTSGTEGIFYNPVNFWYPATSGNYDFFQVDFGLGNDLGGRTGWIMTYSYTAANGTRLYPYTTMPGITVTAGSTYTVEAMLEPTALANPPAYVVQVTLGTNSWLYSKTLGYTPSLGSVKTFQSYNDEYTESAGSASNYLSDTDKTPQLVEDVSNALHLDGGTHVTAMSSFNTPNTGVSVTTRGILAVSPTNTINYNDLVQCSSWS